MSNAASVERVLARVSDQELTEVVFKAITTSGGRHGIRLEKEFWNVLDAIAALSGQSVSELVGQINLSSGNEKKNLTAQIRLFCLLWQSQNLDAIGSMGGERLAISLVKASVQPAIALSSEKRLIASNDQFLSLVRSRFTVPAGVDTQSDLRLALDLPLQQVIEQLKENGNKPVNVGVAMGLSDQRLRRTMNAVLIKGAQSEVIVGFIA